MFFTNLDQLLQEVVVVKNQRYLIYFISIKVSKNKFTAMDSDCDKTSLCGY